MNSFDAEVPAEVQAPAASALSSEDFAAFFRDVHGHDPFRGSSASPCRYWTRAPGRM